MSKERPDLGKVLPANTHVQPAFDTDKTPVLGRRVGFILAGGGAVAGLAASALVARHVFDESLKEELGQCLPTEANLVSERVLVTLAFMADRNSGDIPLGNEPLYNLNLPAVSDVANQWQVHLRSGGLTLLEECRLSPALKRLGFWVGRKVHENTNYYYITKTPEGEPDIATLGSDFYTLAPAERAIIMIRLGVSYFYKSLEDSLPNIQGLDKNAVLTDTTEHYLIDLFSKTTWSISPLWVDAPLHKEYLKAVQQRQPKIWEDALRRI